MKQAQNYSIHESMLWTNVHFLYLSRLIPKVNTYLVVNGVLYFFADIRLKMDYNLSSVKLPTGFI